MKPSDPRAAVAPGVPLPAPAPNNNTGVLPHPQTQTQLPLPNLPPKATTSRGTPVVAGVPHPHSAGRTQYGNSGNNNNNNNNRRSNNNNMRRMQEYSGGHDRSMKHYGPAGGTGMQPPPPPPNQQQQQQQQQVGGNGRQPMMNRKGGGGRNFSGGDNPMGRSNNNTGGMMRNHHHNSRGTGNGVPFHGGRGGGSADRRNMNMNSPSGHSNDFIPAGGPRNPMDNSMRRNGGPPQQQQQNQGHHQHHNNHNNNNLGSRRRGPMDQGQGPPGVLPPPPPNDNNHNRDKKYHPQGVPIGILPGPPMPPPPPPAQQQHQQQQHHLGGSGVPRGNLVTTGSNNNMGHLIQQQQQQQHRYPNGNNNSNSNSNNMMRSPPPPPPPPPHQQQQQQSRGGTNHSRHGQSQDTNGRPQMEQHRRGLPPQQQQQAYHQFQQQQQQQQQQQPFLKPMPTNAGPPQQQQPPQFPPNLPNQRMQNNADNTHHSQPQQHSRQQFAPPTNGGSYPDQRQQQQQQQPQYPQQYAHPSPSHLLTVPPQAGQPLVQHGMIQAPLQSPPLSQGLGQSPHHPANLSSPSIMRHHQQPPGTTGGGTVSHLPMAQSVLQQTSTQQQQHMQPHQHPHTQHHQTTSRTKSTMNTTTFDKSPMKYADTTTATALTSNWTAHKAPTGVNYYYNAVTQESTYERPAGMPAETETTTTSTTPAASTIHPASSRDGTPNRTAATTTTTTVGQDAGETTGGGKWKEYLDQASGKTYYYDGERTTWDKPSDFNPSPSSPNTNKRRTSTTTTQEDIQTTSTPRKKKKSTSTTNPTYNNKAEAMAAFKGLLLAKDISPILKWNDVVKTCSADSRWEACTTMGERKQALAEFQTRRANELREQKRQEKVRAKEAFVSLLTEVLPNVRAFHGKGSGGGGGGNDTGFGEVRDSLSKDDRFYAVEEEGKREELFYDFVEELRKREERQRRGRKRDAKEAFVVFLKLKEDGGNLTFASTWTSFLGSLEENDKGDKRFIVSSAMSDSDRQLYFADFVIELQAMEDEKRRRIRDARRSAEKAQRDAYRDTLRSMATQGKIIPSSRWRNFEDMLSLEGTFGPVSEQDRDAPRDMFEDFVDDWADSYRRDKVFLSRLFSTFKTLIVTVDTQYGEFTKALLEEAAYSPDVYSDARRVLNREEPLTSAKLFFNELVLQAKKDGQSSISFGRRRGGAGNRDDSSADEGEIVEDGEVEEDTTETAVQQELT